MNLIVAHSNNVIGNGDKIPWKISSELKYFRKVTDGSVLIVGRKTYETLPVLRNREIIVVSSKGLSYDEAVEKAKTYEKPIFIIGGQQLYQLAINDPRCTTLLITKILKPTYGGDKYFPELDTRFRLVKEEFREEDGHLLSYNIYTRHDEYQYLSLIENIIRFGNVKAGTKFITGNKMTFNLNYQFPLLTTKKTFMKAIVHELLWFIKGSTSSQELEQHGVNIWKMNGKKEFLQKRGIMNREEGDLGPVYGFQWRHFGLDYKTSKDNYSGGVDQIRYVIDELRNNPDSRRAIITAWNPKQIDEMALPPCHVISRFHMYEGKLSCTLYQRSCDVGLGVPFNIASYALLTCMIGKVLKVPVHELIYLMDDSHIYLDHVEPLLEQVKRNPYQFPKLHLQDRDNIDDFIFDDIKIENYESHNMIKMKMIC